MDTMDGNGHGRTDDRLTPELERALVEEERQNRLRAAMAGETPDDIERLRHQNEVMEDALNGAWRAIYPDGSSWEYPGHVVLHVRAVVEELATAKHDLEQAQKEVARLSTAGMCDCGHGRTGTTQVECCNVCGRPLPEARWTLPVEHRGLLMWLLYRHQGGHSPIGLLIRQHLGIGRFDRLTEEQVKAAYQYREKMAVEANLAAFVARQEAGHAD